MIKVVSFNITHDINHQTENTMFRKCTQVVVGTASSELCDCGSFAEFLVLQKHVDNFFAKEIETEVRVRVSGRQKAEFVKSYEKGDKLCIEGVPVIERNGRWTSCFVGEPVSESTFLFADRLITLNRKRNHKTSK